MMVLSAAQSDCAWSAEAAGVSSMAEAARADARANRGNAWIIRRTLEAFPGVFHCRGSWQNPRASPIIQAADGREHLRSHRGARTEEGQRTALHPPRRGGDRPR